MRARLSVLRASRRLLRPGGRAAYYTIHIAPGLSRSAYRRAARIGPRSVSSRRSPAALLRAAGFHGVEEIDVTAEYLATARAWLEARRRYAAGLRRTFGDSVFEQRLASGAATVSAIEEGLLRRSLLVGLRGGRRASDERRGSDEGGTQR